MKPNPSPAPHSPVRTPAPEVAVVGTGRAGLVTAACLAGFGHRVVVFDAEEAVVARLTRGDPAVHEDGLPTLVREQREAGRLLFTSDPEAALAQVATVIIAVATPAASDGAMDLSAIDALTPHLRAHVRAPALVVLSSTVPVGSARELQGALAQAGETPPRVLSLPDFMRAGSAIADFLAPDRLIVGDDLPAGVERQRLLGLFAPLIAAGVPVLEMDTRSAELTKCAASAMLAARVSFINEIAAIASATGADIEQVCAGIGSDPRIGPDYLHAGLGYGGAGLGKEVANLRETARRHNLRSDMLLATERVNSRQRCWAFDALGRDLGGREGLRGLRVAIWGLAFKPGTDDMCEAPSLALVDRLWRAGAQLRLFDPVAMPHARASITETRRIEWADSAAEALHDADVLVLATEWAEFLDFDPQRASGMDNLRAVYDGRNALDTAAWTAAGVRVVQVGRASSAGRLKFERRAATPVYLHVSEAEVEARSLT